MTTIMTLVAIGVAVTIIWWVHSIFAFGRKIDRAHRNFHRRK